MTTYERVRAATILAGGVLVAGLSLAAPAPLAGNNCLEPWLDTCRASTQACTSCTAYCSNLGSECIVEYSHCAVDENYCPSEGAPVYNACSCKEQSGGGGGRDPGSPE